MAGFFERFSRVAQQTANEAKLRLDIRNLGGKLDERAQALGHLVFRQHQGEAVSEPDFVKILEEMDQVVAARKGKDAELEALRQRAAAPAPAAPEPRPAPAAATEAPAAPAAAPEAPAAQSTPEAGEEKPTQSV
jgi:hypothetical protein